MQAQFSCVGNGICLWTEEGSEAIYNFRDYIKNNWFIIAANTQLAEKLVKDCIECTRSENDFLFANMLSICRSAAVFDYKEDIKKEASDRVLCNNKHMSTGKIGTRTYIKPSKTEITAARIRDISVFFYSQLVSNKTIQSNIELLEM